MALETTPIFYYIDGVTTDNQFANFVEPDIAPTELLATVESGNRSVTDLLLAVQTAFNASASNDITLTLNRDTRIVTLSSTGNIDLLVTSGTNSAQSIYSLIGFTSDKTGSNTYDGDVPIASTYTPQFPVQDYTPFEHYVDNIESSVNESAGGQVEAVLFSPIQRMELNITYITDRPQGKDAVIVNNPNAVQEALDFLSFITRKTELEFMRDRTDLNTFDKVVFEKGRGSRQGTGFKLRELVGRNLNGFYETGILTFRKLV